MHEEIHQYFSDNKAGIKQNFNHIERHAKHILTELLKYSNEYSLMCRNLSEIAFLYVNRLTSIPRLNNRRLKFFRYTKGYWSQYTIDDYEQYPKLINFIETQSSDKVSSLEQRIKHRHYFMNELDQMFNNFGHVYTRRTKIWMLINKISIPPKCKECENYVDDRKSTTGFRLTCSNECEIERTNSCRKSKFTLSNGQLITIMGYEGYVYNKLLDLTSYQNIVYGSKLINRHIGKTYYDFEIKRIYYPDFYLIDQRKVIEVKSSYTYQADLLKNIEKAKACINKNLSFEFWIHDQKKILRMHKDYSLTTILYTNYNIND